MKKAIIGIILVGTLAGGLLLVSRNLSGKTPPYKLVPVTRGRLIEKAVATGTLRPKREISVKSKISGLVHHSFHEVGDRVMAGEPLFEILPDPTPLELTEARREVEIARNIFEQTDKRHE